MRRSVAALAAAGVMLAAAPGWAQAPGTPPSVQPGQSTGAGAPQDPGLGRRVALVHRYFADLKMDQMLHNMMASMMPAMIDQMSKASPGMPREAREALLQSVQETGDAEFPKLLEASARIYANVYTEQELLGICTFYESPIGQSLISKNGQIAAQSGQLVKGLMPEFQSEMLRRLCGKINCAAAKIKVPTA